ncbi:MAG: twin-arginine translocase subunit TatC [Anaerolineae bacterium]|jgi:sec-independent protein translocase protein TatC|nr:twin-arginine translocase subunit TatC [Anaerolineae bacterium]MBT7074450.1 twin-arginine translocase subunit TatC [Anaerolineae bacterium]MBT7781939.1 twin-arginine translocase subunit TatC [Anaerolineae bacterium]
MRKFFNKLWRIITAPFRLIWIIITSPFKAWKKAKAFLNEEPEEHSLIDTAASTIQSSEARASLFDHIEVLRKHLFRALLALIITVSISFIFTQGVIDYLSQPVGGINALRSIDPTESISVFMRVALMSGTILALPYVAFEVWYFLAPGLKPRSKKFGIIGIPLSAILFTSGVAFTYYIMLPAALPFLLNFMGIQAELRPSSYFGFILNVMFWIGVSFEFPLVIYVLSSVGFVKPEVLKSQWRLAIVIIAIVAAAITPTIDPVNMGLVMLPMMLLYFISIGLSYIAYNSREKNI